MTKTQTPVKPLLHGPTGQSLLRSWLNQQKPGMGEMELAQQIAHQAVMQERSNTTSKA